MEDTATGTLAGRAVVLRSVGFGVALDAQAVLSATNDQFASALVVLVASAHWEDTGEKVFADVDAVKAWPMRDMGDLTALARAATDLNGPRKRSEPPPQANGAVHDDSPHPT